MTEMEAETEGERHKEGADEGISLALFSPRCSFLAAPLGLHTFVPEAPVLLMPISPPATPASPPSLTVLLPPHLLELLVCALGNPRAIFLPPSW